jgi:dTMP kinase
VRTKRRTNEKQQGDRLDAEDARFHSRVRDAYLKIAVAEPDRVKVIETTGSVEETHARVKEIVSSFLKKREQVSAKAK